MEGTSYQTIFVYIILPLFGIGIIVSALIWRKHLSGREVLDLTAEKLGLALKADAFGLVVLIGFVMVSAGVFFLYRGYESRIATLQTDIEKMQNKVINIDNVIKEFKEYDLRLNLLFPEKDQANPFTATVNAYVHKKGESAEKPYDLVTVERGSGGIVVYFDKLGLGDKVYVIAEDSNNKWRSDDMITPAAHLQMNRIND